MLRLILASNKLNFVIPYVQGDHSDTLGTVKFPDFVSLISVLRLSMSCIRQVNTELSCQIPWYFQIPSQVHMLMLKQSV